MAGEAHLRFPGGKGIQRQASAANATSKRCRVTLDLSWLIILVAKARKGRRLTNPGKGLESPLGLFLYAKVKTYLFRSVGLFVAVETCFAECRMP